MQKVKGWGLKGCRGSSGSLQSHSETVALEADSALLEMESADLTGDWWEREVSRKESHASGTVQLQNRESRAGRTTVAGR